MSLPYDVAPYADICHCGGTMRPGKAIAQTATGTPDFPDGAVVTMSPGGPGKLIDCIKCDRCGFSLRRHPYRCDAQGRGD